MTQNKNFPHVCILKGVVGEASVNLGRKLESRLQNFGFARRLFVAGYTVSEGVLRKPDPPEWGIIA
jgi:hypothetical protein